MQYNKKERCLSNKEAHAILKTLSAEPTYQSLMSTKLFIAYNKTGGMVCS